MRKILVASLAAGVMGVGASVAMGAGFTLTEPKAERILVRDATVQLASAERASLENELRREITRFHGLELAALELGDEGAMWTYSNAANRYQSALRAIQRGLDVASANCTGTGRVIQGRRFERFNCLVTSDVLSIPSVEVGSTDDGQLPAVVEGQPRELGPLLTQYRVRATGRSTVQYR